jgi:four helix bundle protein
MSEPATEFKNRTKQFALRVIRVVQAIDSTHVGRRLGDQLLRAGTSVGANYRAACRARSPAEFRAKLGIVEEECDESMFWMELISESGLLPETKLTELHQEGDEILSMVVASINTSKRSS